MTFSPMLPNSGIVGAGLLALTVLSGGAQAGSVNVSCARDRAIFLTDKGPRAVRIEIADDAEERARGLMFRKSLPADHGMLFIYETPREASFWMRNTYIPLDMIFLDARGVVRHIHKQANPLDETPVPGARPGDPDPLRLMVLEVAAGEADRLGLAIDQPMAHPALDQATAALSCS